MRTRLWRARDGPLRGLRCDQIHDRTARGRRQDVAVLPRRFAARERGAGGDASRDLARRVTGYADHDRSCLRPRADATDPLGAAKGIEGLWRNVHAIYLPDRRRYEGPQHGRDGRQIRLLAAAARPRVLGCDLGGHQHRRVSNILVRPLSRFSSSVPRAKRTRKRARPSVGCPMELPASRCACRSCSPRASTRAGSRPTNSWR